MMRVIKVVIVTLLLLLSSQVSWAMDTEENAKQELTYLIGEHVWYMQAEAARLQNDDAMHNSEYHSSLRVFWGRITYNLEPLILQSVDFDHATFTFQKLDGELINWEIATQKADYRIRKMKYMFDKVFLLQSPYDKHPDWPNHIWSLIRNGEVEIGMTKEMVLYSWGPPYNNYSDDKWRYMAKIYYFTDNILTRSERCLPIHPLHP